jgi:hypothetical protein
MPCWLYSTGMNPSRSGANAEPSKEEGKSSSGWKSWGVWKSWPTWLAPVLTFPVAATGAYFGFWNANKSAEDKQQQSIFEYRRDHREKIYQDMLVQMNDLDNIAQSVTAQVHDDIETYRVTEGHAADDRAPLSDADDSKVMMTAENKWGPPFERLTAAVNNAELVSSKDVINYSKALLGAYSAEFVAATYGQMYPEAYSEMKKRDGELDLEYKNGPESSLFVLVSWRDVRPDLRGKPKKELRQDFIDSARRDLRTDD